ncbi:hypothetical protein [Dactylosporangium salmoneum]|uniref:Uncharacterized protein n=1 Tax=Dactylosporangium salmoneum TaxID=53361 RepID=A0ABP5T8F8_9ACTN
MNQYRILTVVRLHDGSTTEHVSSPMSKEGAEAHANEGNRTGGGRATSTVITEAEYDVMLARFASGQ